jgi:hypothetical protein
MCSDVSEEPAVSIIRAHNEGSRFTNLYGAISQMSIAVFINPSVYRVVQQIQKCRNVCSIAFGIIFQNAVVPPPLSTGNTFQDLPRLRETADNTESYI